MQKKEIGLNTYLYTFPLWCKVSFRQAKEKLSTKGTVTEVYLDNKLGFELKLFKQL